MKQAMRSTRLLALGGLFALSAGFVAATGARESAKPPPIQRSIVYYDDAGAVVGVRRLNCDEPDWGIVTDHQQNFPGCVK